MQAVINLWVRALLAKTFLKTLAHQFYLKLTKFTRRSSGPRSFLWKFAAGCEFLSGMSEYNLDVIKRCRACLRSLTAANFSAVLVYGEKDIVDFLRVLSFQSSVELRLLREVYEPERKVGLKAVPVEMAIPGSEKIIVASLVNTQERIRRLIQLGVDKDRIILLD
jgi:hypothetical protein